MKKNLALLLMLVLCLALAACGGKENEPSGSADIGEGGASQSAEQSSQGGKPSVEIKGDRVIATESDGMGNTTVTDYIYKDAALSEIVMTVKCADEAAAKKLLESYTTGDLKDYGSALYADMKRDGSAVVMKCQESYLTTFSGMTMEQLAALLAGEDPFSAGAGSGADSSGGETTINTAWADMTLPDGFPKLAEGATVFSNDIAGTYTFQWDAMRLADCEAIAGKLEAWSGGALALTEDAGGKNWFADTETCSVTLTYCADTFGGAMPQVMLSVTVW